MSNILDALLFDTKNEELPEDYSDPVNTELTIKFTDQFSITSLRCKNYMTADGKLRVNLVLSDLRRVAAYIQATGTSFIFKEQTPFNTFSLIPVSNTQARETLNSIYFNTVAQKPKTAWSILHEGRNLNAITYSFVCFYSIRPDVFSYFRGYEFEILPAEKFDMRIIKPYLMHIKNIICVGNQEFFDYVIKWLCFLFQHPDKKLETALIFTGDQGTGKNVFTNQICKLLGRYAVQNANFESFTGQFNGSSLSNKRLIVCNEKKNYLHNNANNDVLKSLITESTVDLQYKRRDIIHDENVANFIFLSNNYAPIRIDEGDRRYFVMQVSNAHANDFPYFDELCATFTPEFYQHLLTFFMLQTTQGWDRRKIPMTPAKQNIIMATQDIFYSYIHEIDVNKIYQLGMPRLEAFKHFCDWCKNIRSKTGSMADFKITIMKYCNEERRTDSEGRRAYFYILKDQYKNL